MGGLITLIYRGINFKIKNSATKKDNSHIESTKIKLKLDEGREQGRKAALAHRLLRLFAQKDNA